MKEFLKVFNHASSNTSIQSINPQKMYWKNLLKGYIGKTAIFVTYSKETASLIKIKKVYNDYVELEKSEYSKNGRLRQIINMTVSYADFICNQVKLVILNE